MVQENRSGAIDLIKAFEAGYTAGAKYINPDIKVDVKYLGAAGDNAAWGSPDKAKEIALGWYADGAGCRPRERSRLPGKPLAL